MFLVVKTRSRMHGYSSPPSLCIVEKLRLSQPWSGLSAQEILLGCRWEVEEGREEMRMSCNAMRNRMQRATESDELPLCDTEPTCHHVDGRPGQRSSLAEGSLERREVSEDGRTCWDKSYLVLNGQWPHMRSGNPSPNA